MHKTAQLVFDKLNEYGFDIYKHNPMSKEQYVFFCSEMIIFVQMEENTISISFQATTKPDAAAQCALILSEIKEIEISVMESFIYNDDNKIVKGDAAYNLIEDSIRNGAVNEYKQKEMYEYLLHNVECFEC